MKIKKYPQSHLIVSNGTNKIMIDPGSLTFAQGLKVEDIEQVDAILVTHSHPDHLDPQNAKALIGEKPVYGNSDVVRALREIGIPNVTEVKDRQKFSVAGFEIEPVDLPHCKMQDGTDGPPNTGFLINGVLFHPGDGDVAPASLVSADLALPIAGPTITFDGALKFAQDVKAKIVIPIHYDFFKADPQEFKKLAEPAGIEVRPLASGQETEV